MILTYTVAETGLFYLNYYEWDTSNTYAFNIINLSLYESGIASGLEHFDGTGLNVANTTSYANTFRNNRTIKSVDIHNWSMRSGYYYENMLDGTTSLTRLDLGPNTTKGSSQGYGTSHWQSHSDN